jgi:hypothetical protein
MHMRHIRPRSVDWYDATFEEGARGSGPLGPDEKAKLRQVGESEAQISLQAIDDATLAQRGLKLL